MSFVQSTYLVDETDESVEIEMILSNQSSVDLVVQVTSCDIQATGKHLGRKQDTKFLYGYRKWKIFLGENV